MPDDKKELIQHLFEASTANKKFQERFQSFLDQIPKPSGASAAPEKEGFFINFFLGMFASLKSTKLAAKLELQNLHFREVQVIRKDLHVIAEFGEDKKKHLFVFSESKGKKSSANLEEEIKNIGDNIGKNVGTKVLIGREILEGEEKKKKEDQRWKFKVLVEHKTSKNPEVKDFKKVDCKADENLEGSIVKLATGDFQDSIDVIEKIIQEAKKLYSDLKGKNLVQNSSKEAAQHGFISGMLINFRYRYNLKLYLELLTGRGYSDIMLLVRGKERSWSAVPVVMELKAEGNVNNALTEAESYARGLRRNKMRLLTNADKAICIGINLNEQKKSYKISEVASKIKRNEEPIMQSLFNTVYSNEDTQNRMENLLGQVYYTFPSEQYTRDYLSRFLLGQLPLVKKPKKAKDIKVCLFNHSEADIQDRLTTYMIVIKEQINKSKMFIFHVQEAGSEKFKYNKYSFTEEILNKIGLKQGEIRQVTQVYVMGYGETGPSQSAPSPGTFYQNKDLVKVENKDSREYFEGTFSSQGRETRSITSKNKFKGEVQLINPVPKLIDKFREAINYQQKGLMEEIEGKEKELGRNDNKFELGAYKNLFDAVKELMCDENGKPKQSLVSMISSENRFKAFLDGLFTGLSDLDKDRVIAVLTEFQVGEGGRVDIMVQVVDNENPDEKKKMEKLKESVSVGFELKYSETTKEAASEKLKEANNQIEGYARSQNIKSITEGDKVAFIGVVFNSNADKRDNLILVSEKFIVAGVPHSSIEIMGGKLSTSASEITLGVAKLGVNEPSTSRGVR
ncbi:hypothetical protein [Wolbachia endosymbiont (group A) of Machimus atricapillus]|uniref:hypothetical protein n=1 Tax=Wolbachia endosymbiont (group A) of Machimus atricapillus TaxID=3066147 RepID=UPI003132E4B9